MRWIAQILIALAVIAGMTVPVLAGHGADHTHDGHDGAAHHQQPGSDLHAVQKTAGGTSFYTSPLASCDAFAGHCVVFADVRPPFRVTSIVQSPQEAGLGLHEDPGLPDRRPETDTPPPRV